MRWAALAAALWAPVGTAAEVSTQADPWHPAAVAAAEAAVARLGAKRALDIRATVVSIRSAELKILGLASGVAGGGRAIVATVQHVQQAMQALGARETALQVTVDLPADVLFDFDKADIRPDAAQALGRLATLVRAYTGRVLLEGHTDSMGGDAYNERLSARRAEAVKAWLVAREGIVETRIRTRGGGERQPVASNDTEQGRQRNRRVTAVISKQP